MKMKLSCTDKQLPRGKKTPCQNKIRKRDTLTSLKSVPKSVSRKERPGTLFTCYHAKSDKVALRRKKYIFFFSTDAAHFWREKVTKSRVFPQKSREMAEIRQFAAIFGVFPRFSEFYREKKRPRHAKSVLGASGRASHHAKSDTWKERLFGNNYVAQKVMGRSIGRSLKKLR